ncbi:MAG TPA: hypothetical protein VGI84_10920 [Pseudonocardiaceae bacterium]|jgi:hypothetical protein
MADEQMHRQLSAALRAQASGLGSGAPPAAPPGRSGAPGGSGDTADEPPQRQRTSAWTVLSLAVLLGTVAGALAGVISAW